MLRDERIDDLQVNNLRVIQNTKKFCFGIDAVLLANFVRSKPKYNILEIGTGTGIIPILLSAKIKFKQIDAIEIQKDMAEMASRSVELNSLENKIKIHNFDIKDYKDKIKKGYYNIVVSNPPYGKVGAGEINQNDSVAMSRHEFNCSLNDLVEASCHGMQSNGSLYLIHRADRIADIIVEMRKYCIEPKNIRFVYPKINKAPNLVLIRGIKGGNSEVKNEPPLIIYNNDGQYTEEMKSIYGIFDS